MSTRRSTRSAGNGTRRRDEAGTGLIATVAGVFVFLVLLLLATQVLFDLYATSTVTAVAYDAARIVAGADGGPEAVSDAEAGARRQLGRYADGAVFSWQRDADAVRLHVTVRNPSLLPPAFKRALGIDVVDRTVRVRTERVR